MHYTIGLAYSKQPITDGICIMEIQQYNYGLNYD